MSWHYFISYFMIACSGILTLGTPVSLRVALYSLLRKCTTQINSYDPFELQMSSMQMCIVLCGAMSCRVCRVFLWTWLRAALKPHTAPCSSPVGPP